MRTVAVSQRVRDVADRGERRDELDQALARFIAAAGFLPVPVPNTLADSSALLAEWLDAVRPVCVVLSGGGDVGADPDRDRVEAGLLGCARRGRWAVLGICRGMQSMALEGGATLVAVGGHVRSSHMLDGEPSRVVNSFHELALASCPEDFRVTSRAPDGVIESIAHESLPWHGWMWHPEREIPFVDDDIERFRSVVAGSRA